MHLTGAGHPVVAQRSQHSAAWHGFGTPLCRAALRYARSCGCAGESAGHRILEAPIT
jgi:hypothetical protein